MWKPEGKDRVKNYLIFDFGASNGRASVAAFNGTEFTFETIHRFDNIPVFAAGTLYWDILRLFSELKTGILLASKKYRDIRSIGLDTWGVDFGFLDKNGKLISNPVHYRDAGRNSVTEEVFEIIPRKDVFKFSGVALHSYYSIFNMHYLKKNSAVEYLNASKFLMIPDIFNYFLTGIAVNEFTDSHTTALCNPYTKLWDSGIIEKLGFSKEIFGRIVQSGTAVGPLQKSVSEELEIKSIPVIAPATHDTPSAILGVPFVEKNVTPAFISIGTWGITVYEMDSPLINDEVYNSGYANEAGAEGKMLLFKNFVGMWLIQQCRNKWIKDKGSEISFDDIMNSARNAQPVDSFIDLDSSDFIVNQNDLPKVISSFCSRTGQKVPEGIDQTARIIYQTLALKIKDDLEILAGLIGRKIDYLHIVGGGTKDELFCQWVTDAAGIPAFAGPTETSSVGNLLMQLKADGEIKGIEDGRQLSFNSFEVKRYKPQNPDHWDRQYAKFKSVMRSLQ